MINPERTQTSRSDATCYYYLFIPDWKPMGKVLNTKLSHPKYHTDVLQ